MSDEIKNAITTEEQQPWKALPEINVGEGFTHLKGYRILDLTTSIAGPYATMLLSDFGAEVIKVERSYGDDARAWGPPFFNEHSPWFASVNRNKKSVVLDLRDKDKGYKQFVDLLETSDILICNLPHDSQERLGIDYETLKKIKPDLIHASITGFGIDGTRSHLTCYDLIAEGYSGVMDLTGEADGAPQKIGAPAADMLAGQDAAMSIMASIIKRNATGQGAKIDVSLVESMIRFLACRITTYMVSGENPTRSGGADSVIAIYQSFETADKPMTLGLGNDRIWKRFWVAVENPNYADHAEFFTNADRREHRKEIVQKIQNILYTKNRSEWLKIFANARVPAGPINKIKETVADTHFQERDLFFTLRDGQRYFPQVGLGIRINDCSARPRALPPELGQHTDKILGS